MNRTCNPLGLRIAKMLPRALQRWVVINVWAEATTGKYSDTEAPALTVVEALRRWEPSVAEVQRKVLSTTDATVWAREFTKQFIWSGRASEIDELLMLGWFANAIHVGRREGERAASKEVAA